jgi:hypothetical protein
MKQLACFLGATLLSKIVLGLLIFIGRAELDTLTIIIFRTFQLQPATELTIVMVVCPIFLNALQYWLQDNFLAGHGTPDAGGPRRIKVFRELCHRRWVTTNPDFQGIVDDNIPSKPPKFNCVDDDEYEAVDEDSDEEFLYECDNRASL